MDIYLSPIRSDENLLVEKQGDILTINSVEYDFTPLPEGATLTADAVDCPWVVKEVRRENGVLSLYMLVPHGPNAPEETRFPQPLLGVVDGPVPIPPANKPEEEEENDN
jgi:hypothetical protein